MPDNYDPIPEVPETDESDMVHVSQLDDQLEANQNLRYEIGELRKTAGPSEGNDHDQRK